MTSVSSDITTNTNNDSSMLLVDHSQSTVSTTLADLPFTLDIPLLRRRDLEVGPLLGKGRYSQVHSITSIRFPSSTTTSSATNGEYRDHRNDAGTSDNDDTNQTAEQQRQEQQPCRRYVMKHLQNKLFENRTHRRFAKDLTNALADLVLEAMYLSKLRHPNIITLRGLTLGGTSVLKRKGAVADDYFLILDQLDQTLDRRIHQTWKQKNDNTVELVLTKTRYALQIADALSYLHDHQVRLCITLLRLLVFIIIVSIACLFVCMFVCLFVVLYVICVAYFDKIINEWHDVCLSRAAVLCRASCLLSVLCC